MEHLLLVGQFRNGEDLPWAKVEEFRHYLVTLGFEPNDYLAAAVITRDGDGVCRLHLSKLARRDGRPYLDLAKNDVVTSPVIVEVAAGSWPTWFTGLNVPTNRLVGTNA